MNCCRCDSSETLPTHYPYCGVCLTELKKQGLLAHVDFEVEYVYEPVTTGELSLFTESGSIQ